MPNNPPRASVTSGIITSLVESLSGISRRRAWTILALAFAGVVLIDSCTGHDVSLALPYLIIVSFTAWCIGEGVGAAVAFLLVISSALVNETALITPIVGPHPSEGTIIWNLIVRGTTMALMALIVHALRVTLEMERWRASTDRLTGALNKQAFHRRMSAAAATARRRDAALVLAYLDLDGFKAVNDCYGHSAGDRVLTAFAKGAADAIGSGDVLARIGGDEFLVLLTVPTVETGDTAAEVLHARLSGVLRETGFAVTCSMGAIVVDSHQLRDDDSFIQMADHLMYEVKRTGKNALRIARGDLLGDTLRAAFPPADLDGLEVLLARIDNADRAMTRKAAA